MLFSCLFQRQLKVLIPRVVVFVNDPPSAERKVDLILLSFLLFYGLMVGKYTLIRVIYHIFSGFALFTELSVSRS